jgi:hypothetical protein
LGNPTDIDIIVDHTDLEQIAEDNLWLTRRRPTVLVGDHVEIRAKLLTLHVGRHQFFWEFDQDAQSRLGRLRLGSEIFPVLSAEDTVVMKCILQRGEDRGKWDLVDVKHILESRGEALDKDYLVARATRCDALERVRSCLANLGYTL